MSNKKNQALENFIRDWHWDEQSHEFAQNLGLYLFQFMDHLHEQRLSKKTARKHRGNCWHIGILECQYGYKDKFTPGGVFYSPNAGYEYEFKRKMGDSMYAINSYRATWKKVYQYTKGLGYLDNEQR